MKDGPCSGIKLKYFLPYRRPNLAIRSRCDPRVPARHGSVNITVRSIGDVHIPAWDGRVGSPVRSPRDGRSVRGPIIRWILCKRRAGGDQNEDDSGRKSFHASSPFSGRYQFLRQNGKDVVTGCLKKQKRPGGRGATGASLRISQGGDGCFWRHGTSPPSVRFSSFVQSPRHSPVARESA